MIFAGELLGEAVTFIMFPNLESHYRNSQIQKVLISASSAQRGDQLQKLFSVFLIKQISYKLNLYFYPQFTKTTH